jgi:hypothetical protein
MLPMTAGLDRDVVVVDSASKSGSSMSGIKIETT